MLLAIAFHAVIRKVSFRLSREQDRALDIACTVADEKFKRFEDIIYTLSRLEYRDKEQLKQVLNAAPRDRASGFAFLEYLADGHCGDHQEEKTGPGYIIPSIRDAARDILTAVGRVREPYRVNYIDKVMSRDEILTEMKPLIERGFSGMMPR